jgi:hypothetical protein
VRRPSSGATEGVNPGNLLTKNEPVNVFGAFLRLHALEIGHVSDAGARLENPLAPRMAGL